VLMMVVQQESASDRRLAWLWRNFALERLNFRVRYLMKRFGKHAFYWQFFIWFRLLALDFIAFLPALIDGYSAADNSQVQLTMEPGNLEASGVRQWVIFMHAGVFLGVMIATAAWTRYVRPHPHYFQNKLEGWLAVSAITIVVWGLLYTVVEYPSYTLEVLMSLTLGLTILFTVSYLLYRYGRGYNFDVNAMVADLGVEDNPVVRRISVMVGVDPTARSTRVRASTLSSKNLEVAVASSTVESAAEGGPRQVYPRLQTPNVVDQGCQTELSGSVVAESHVPEAAITGRVPPVVHHPHFSDVGCVSSSTSLATPPKSPSQGPQQPEDTVVMTEASMRKLQDAESKSAAYLAMLAERRAQTEDPAMGFPVQPPPSGSAEAPTAGEASSLPENMLKASANVVAATVKMSENVFKSSGVSRLVQRIGETSSEVVSTALATPLGGLRKPAKAIVYSSTTSSGHGADVNQPAVASLAEYAEFLPKVVRRAAASSPSTTDVPRSLRPTEPGVTEFGDVYAWKPAQPAKRTTPGPSTGGVYTLAPSLEPLASISEDAQAAIEQATPMRV